VASPRLSFWSVNARRGRLEELKRSTFSRCGPGGRARPLRGARVQCNRSSLPVPSSTALHAAQPGYPVRRVFAECMQCFICVMCTRVWWIKASVGGMLATLVQRLWLHNRAVRCTALHAPAGCINLDALCGKNCCVLHPAVGGRAGRAECGHCSSAREQSGVRRPGSAWQHSCGY
jgi:hypothetical protein